jgi:hypothetical protein
MAVPLPPTPTPTATPTPKFIMWNQVKGTSYETSEKGRPTFLNIGKNYPDRSRFAVVIWGRNRSAFSTRPEVLY